MPLPSKSLDQITEGDLLALVQAGEAESKVIEYKETLPGNADSDKKEFLYDVSSFANAAGGTLVYGMKARDGVPVELTGIAGINSDAEKLRLQAIFQSGLQPRIPGVEIEVVALTNGNKALLIRIPRSWVSPHMVTFKGGSKFYSRHSNGKYQLDVTELRSAFLASETVLEKMAVFRTERLAKILNDETPVRINEPARIVFHLLPLSSFTPGYAVDINRLKRLQGGSFPTFYSESSHQSSYLGEHNFEGYAYFVGNHNHPSSTYTQVFRSGCIEVVDSSILKHNGDKKIIHAWLYEKEIVNYLQKLLQIENHLGVTPPFVVALSLLKVRGGNMYSTRSGHGSRPIDRDHLLLPDVLLEEFDADMPKLLKPAFDAAWNACGYQGSESFDSHGNWRA